MLAFFADEEHGGARGAKWMARNHPDDFHGATEAISEVGGFSMQVAGRRVYLIQTAEKGIQWLRLVGARASRGTARWCTTTTRSPTSPGRWRASATHQWPVEISPTVERLLRGTAEIIGVEYDRPEERVRADHRGTRGRWARWLTRRSATPRTPR